jgi:hypothetical protein
MPRHLITLRLCASVALILAVVSCSEDRTGPSPVASAPESAPTAPDSSTADTVVDAEATRAGIVFGSFNMPNSYLNSVHTGWMQGGPLSPENIISWLSGARAKGGRVVVKLCKGKDQYVKNSDGTFSFTKWKSLVDRYKKVNIGPYISDGTIIGHYLIDEPHRASRWGGKVISQSTLEAMAKYSKQLWPGMATIVRVAPTWLASSSVKFTYLDAGWAQYTAGKGSAGSWVASEAAAAKRKGLGLVVGLNVLDGGNGSSKIRGYTGGKWAMSASELRSYGGAMLGQGLACGFFNWTHNVSYYGRSDIKNAMAELSAKARGHARTSCKQ